MANQCLACLLRPRLKPTSKDHFYVVIGPTDECGNACLTREEILERTESTSQLFVMDYGHPETSATGRIVIRLMRLPDIEGALEAYH